MLALEGDRGALGVVLIVGVSLAGSLDDRAEVALQCREPVQRCLALFRQQRTLATVRPPCLLLTTSGRPVRTERWQPATPAGRLCADRRNKAGLQPWQLTPSP